MKILLTSAAFRNKKIKDKFLELLDKPVLELKVLFIPTAAIDNEAKYHSEKCQKELLECGIEEQNLRIYDFEYQMTEKEALTYDVLYFPGGNPKHLLARIKENAFDTVIRCMIESNKFYVGVSAGSLIMTPNISLEDPQNPITSGLGYLPAFVAVHWNEPNEQRFTKIQKKLPLKLITLNDLQAVLINEEGYSIIE